MPIFFNLQRKATATSITKPLLTLLFICFSVFAQAQYNHSLDNRIIQQVAHKPLANNARLGGGSQQTSSTTYPSIYDSLYDYKWDSLALTWNIAKRLTNFVYDAHQNMLGYLVQNWSGTAWVNYHQYSNTYDANNNNTSYTMQTYSVGAWVNSHQDTYTYDSHNNQTSDLYQTWNTGTSAWKNSGQATLTYDANNNNTSTLNQSWNTGTSAWDNSSQQTYTYNANNNQTSQLQQTWNGTSWDNNSQDSYTYNANYKMTSDLTQSWNGTAWDNSYLDTYTYDANNNNTSQLQQTWNGTAWTNGNGYLYTNTYDANNNYKTSVTDYYNPAGTKVIYGDSSVYYFSGLCVPLTPHICMVSTDSASNYQYNIVYWNKVGYTHVDSFLIYRYDVISASYLHIGSVSRNALSEFKDTAFNIGGPNGGSPQYAGWKYKIAILDTCGHISTLSPYHQSTFVQESGSAFSWTPYIDSGYTSLPTGYSFLRDDNNTGAWHILANVVTTSSTDPSYSSFPNANWRVDAVGFTCNPTLRLSGNNSTDAAKIRAHSNQNNNRTTGIKSHNQTGVTIFSYGNAIITNGTIQQGQQLKVFNTLGQVVLTTALQNNIETTLPSGIYTIQVIDTMGSIIEIKKCALLNN